MFNLRLLLFRLRNCYVTELNAAIMAEKADMSFFLFQAWVVLAVHCPCHANLFDIRIDYCSAIEIDCDMPAFGDDLLVVPLAQYAVPP